MYCAPTFAVCIGQNGFIGSHLKESCSFSVEEEPKRLLDNFIVFFGATFFAKNVAKLSNDSKWSPLRTSVNG
jgi:hypothetical protein